MLRPAAPPAAALMRIGREGAGKQGNQHFHSASSTPASIEYPRRWAVPTRPSCRPRSRKLAPRPETPLVRPRRFVAASAQATKVTLTKNTPHQQRVGTARERYWPHLASIARPRITPPRSTPPALADRNSGKAAREHVWIMLAGCCRRPPAPLGPCQCRRVSPEAAYCPQSSARRPLTAPRVSLYPSRDPSDPAARPPHVDEIFTIDVGRCNAEYGGPAMLPLVLAVGPLVDMDSGGRLSGGQPEWRPCRLAAQWGKYLEVVPATGAPLSLLG